MSRRLAFFAAALAALAVLAAPALPTEPFAPRAEDFSQRVGAATARAAVAGGPVTLAPVRAPGRFDLVGFEWADGRGLDVELRVRRDGEPWGAWLRVPTADGAPRRSDPVWAGGADAYQLRLSRRAPGLRAHFVNATGTRTAADRARTALRRTARAAVLVLAGEAVAEPAGDAPPMVARETWERGQCKPREGPEHGEVSFGVVHHTASATDYGPEDSAAIVLAICRYHRNSNGWNDIGYNFLVDRYGQVFEGRAGGIEAPVTGAHAQGYNASSTGVAQIGTHSGAPAPAEAVRATAGLLAWKLGLHGVPVTGSVTVRSGGGGANRHPDGERVTFARISGHRDGNRTTCPGDALFAQLPEIRRLAAERAAAATPGPRFPSKLQLARATVHRHERRLDLLAPITRRASGDVAVALRAAGRTRRFRAPVDSAAGRVRMNRRIPRSQARLGTGILTVRYAGNARTRPQTLRLRAASDRAHLRTSRPALSDGRVQAGGTVARRARGVVRIRLGYVSGGVPRSVDLQAPIRDGRWRLDEALTPQARREIEARSSSVHASIQFTGHLPSRTRGEARSLQVLAAP